MSVIDEDEALIAAALAGSPHAWEKLVKRYESRVFNQGLRLMGNPSDAMDLLQEVFLGVYRNLHRFRGDAKFSSWLFRIAHNKAIDLSRRKRLLTGTPPPNAEGEADPLESVPADRQQEPEISLMHSELNQRIVERLSQLPLAQRLVVELKVFQSMTFEEIADMQDISENTAKTRFYAALKKLKQTTEDEHVLS
ncbi:MAG: sigma-70 family RNA polymerase sigma factor [Pseudomonadota bacterium]|nr:sigma-70 family RNA polymerase sigma factor [Pseudomonadota bacterium]